MNNIKYDFNNLFSENIGDQSGIDKNLIDKYKDKSVSAHNRLMQARQRGEVGFYDLPDNVDEIQKIIEVSKRVRSKYENMVVLGIGGSALGLRCLSTSILSPYYNFMPAGGRGGCPRLFICDNIDPDSFEPLLQMLDWRQTCVCIISKSGRTTETISQFFLVRELLIKKYGREKWKDHVFIITDPKTGPLRRMANEENIETFNVPVNVGGRFSVLSSVGLFPAACVGLDINSLMDGARDMAKKCTLAEVEENPAYMNGLLNCIFNIEKKVNMSVLMPYADGLEKFSDWYAQLLGESLGKEGKGITPIKALGVTDQHSQLQLYMAGPNDKIITILGVDEFKHNSKLPSNMSEPFEYLSNHSFSDVINAERIATVKALTDAKRPLVLITVDKLNEYNMGALFMAFEIQVAYMGMLMGINPFNQPGVELGKKITKDILIRQ